MPAEAWPATPGRKPCSPSSAWMSRADSAIRSGRHADVLDDQRGPGRRGSGRPARQPLADRPGDLDRARVAGEVRRPISSSSREDLLGARRPARRARRRSPRRTPRAGRPRSAAAPASPAGRPAMFWAATISAGATISSTALAPASTSAGTGRSADSIRRSGARRRRARGFGTVSKTASAMNPSVPSEPTIRRRKISTGVVGVQERAEAVAGRVLDPELLADPLGELARPLGSRRGSRRGPRERRLGLARIARRRPARRCRSPSPTAARRSASGRVR